MTRRLFKIIVFYILPVTFIYSYDSFDIKVYPAIKVSEKTIKIDGIINEAVWKKIPVATGFTYFNKNELSDIQTSFYVVYDDENIYFYIRCAEPLFEKLMPVIVPRDSIDVFSGESVEIFIDPGHQHNFYYQIAISYGGSVFDSKEKDTSWNSNIKVAIGLKDKEWIVEAAIPWNDFEVETRETGISKFIPHSGRVLGMNICRNRKLGGTVECMNWSQTLGGFHDPFRFGHIVLSDDEKIEWEILESELRKGDRQGIIAIAGSEGEQDMVVKYISELKLLLKEMEDLKTGLNEKEQSEIADILRKNNEKIDELQKLFSANRSDVTSLVRVNQDLSKIKAEIREKLWHFKLISLLEMI